MPQKDGQQKRGTKRKLAAEAKASPPEAGVPSQVQVLISSIKAACEKPVDKVDRQALRKHAHQLADHCKDDALVEGIVKAGAVDAVVPLLTLGERADPAVHASFADIRKDACFILGLLAVKPEYQHQIAAARALPGLVKLLAAHCISSPGSRGGAGGGVDAGGAPAAAGGGASAAAAAARSGSGGVARRAADAITNLAHENIEIKNMVRADGGIAPLVRLLHSWDLKVQRAAAGALRTLAFKNDENKRIIVECGALPLLVQMLRSEDPGVHYEAVGVIGNLVHSSQEIKQQVLQEGALQPVINLLSSACPESQREAALLLGQFATQQANDDGPDYKSRIVQRGAVPPLIRMLGAHDVALKEMAAFALGRLAQNAHNQAGIVQAGGLPQLLDLLESKQINLQHNAAFALYGLSDNEDNIPCIIQAGGLQRLWDCSERLQVQASKDCVNKTIARIKAKLERDDRRVLAHVIYGLRSTRKAVQQATAISLAQLSPLPELKSIFVDKPGLDVLLELLTDTSATAKQLTEGACALRELAKKVNATSPVEAQPAQPQKSVYLGEEYVNSKMLADVTFVVEGRPFLAHRIALLASSEAFRAMFGQDFREKEASVIDIPNIGYETFTAMMRYIYVGSVEVAQEQALPLLQASDQYLLEGLKRLCEAALAESLSVDNLGDVWQAAEDYSAPQLAKCCVLFALEHVTEIITQYSSAAAGGGGCAIGGAAAQQPGSAAAAAAAAASAAAAAAAAALEAASAMATSGGSGGMSDDEGSSTSAPRSGDDDEGSPCSSSGSQGGAPQNAAGAAAFAQLMIRMVPALRSSLLEDLQQAAAAADAEGGGADPVPM